jgi:pyruvate carboxylase
MTITEPETAQAPAGVPQSVFVDGNFDSTPGTPGTHTAHGLPPTISRIRRMGEGTGHPLKKLMVANRGEIAIRIFRTAHELAMTSVAIYSFEDRMTAHRYKADEAYQVGKGLDPIAAYLNIKEIVQTAVDHGVDMIQCV